MSYDVYLTDAEGKALPVARHSEGGTYALGGTTIADLNITYNYGKHIRTAMHEDGLKWLHEKKASDTIELLEKAVKTLGTERDSDYWASTKGNAGYALNILLGWAKQHPEGIWEVG